jgi:ectoine_ehuA: ectoine/hydroxyectoine ABC transporter, ATP-binding protein EhuA
LPWSRRSCCSTNRHPRSIRNSSAKCSTSCSTSPRKAWPWWSSPMRSASRARSPTRWCSWMAAWSSNKAVRKSSTIRRSRGLRTSCSTSC